MPKRTVETKFYTYNQNNSGGYFIQNDDVRAFVVIEAQNPKEADLKAAEIFDGYDEYCDCCGKRWYFKDDSFFDDEGDDKPEYGGVCIREHVETDKASLIFGKSAVIYYHDGTKEFIESPEV